VVKQHIARENLCYYSSCLGIKFGIIHSLPVFHRLSKFGIIFTHVLFAKGENVVTKGLLSHSKYPFLAIHAKGGESISPKQKDRTTT
jgi:hypothetical protein